jgi:gamma-glutamylcysteine synthetase
MTNESFNAQQAIPLPADNILIANYGGTGLPFDKNMCGVELERTYVSPDNNLMTPQQSQFILKTLAQNKNGIIGYEKNGQTLSTKQDGAIIKTVTTDDATYSLELSGTLEMATAAYPVTQITPMLQALDNAQSDVSQLAKDNFSLTPDSYTVSPWISRNTYERNAVSRQRLVSELQSFKQLGNDAGLNTMLLATSSQISLSYTDNDTLNQQFIMGSYLAPLYYAAFSNNAGAFNGQSTKLQVPRAQWWLDHNQFAPRAGIPDFVYNDDCDVASAWVSYVKDVPMVYYMDQGQPVFGREKSLNDLQNENPALATLDNYNLAQSLIWTDVRLCNADNDNKRLEFRAADSGAWQAYGVTALTLGLFGTEDSLNQTHDMLSDYGLFKSTEQNKKIITQARQDVPYQELDTSFGQGILFNVFQDAMTIVNKSPLLNNPSAQLSTGLDSLNDIAETGLTDRALYARYAYRKMLTPYGAL